MNFVFHTTALGILRASTVTSLKTASSSSESFLRYLSATCMHMERRDFSNAAAFLEASIEGQLTNDEGKLLSINFLLYRASGIFFQPRHCWSRPYVLVIVGHHSNCFLRICCIIWSSCSFLATFARPSLSIALNSFAEGGLGLLGELLLAPGMLSERWSSSPLIAKTGTGTAAAASDSDLLILLLADVAVGFSFFTEQRNRRIKE